LGKVDVPLHRPRAGTANPLRIAGLIYGSLRLLGGYQVFTYNLLSQLASRGHDVTLYVPHEEVSRHREFYAQLPMHVRGIAVRTGFLFRGAPWILQRYLAMQQVLHQYHVWQVVGAYPAGFLTAGLNRQVPTVLRTYGDDIQIDRSIGYGVRLEEPAGRRAAGSVGKHRFLVAMSDALADCYRELKVPEDKIVSIPNGIDYSRLSQSCDAVAVKRRLEITGSNPVLLTVGRYHRKKGYELIPPIAQQLKAQGLAFEWLIVGRDVETLQEQLDDVGVADRVHLIGEIAPPLDAVGPPLLPTQELVEIYQCADVLVHPSYIEGFPRVLVEGMAAGCAVVTTDAPGCRDVVTDGVNGCVAKAGDAAAIGRAVARMLTEPEARSRLAEAGQEHARQFDWSNVVDEYEKLYYEALQECTHHGS
jgi:glycosyltransferase involved in cell wall biosynthesis